MRSGRTGVLYGLSAYVFWGFVPVYFKAVGRASPLEVLAHRVVWSLLLLATVLAWRSGARAFAAPFRRLPVQGYSPCSTFTSRSTSCPAR